MKLRLKLKHNRELAISAGLVALGLLVGVLGLFTAVLPQQSKAKQLDAQLVAAQAKLVSVHGARGPVIRAADLFQLARAMPDQEDMPGILVNIARVAQAAGVTVSAVQPGAAVAQTDGATAIPLKVSVNGSWSGVTAFLHGLRTQVQVRKNGARLKTTGRLFVIDSVQLAGASGTPAPGDVSTAEVNANLELSAFTYGIALPPPAVTTTGTTTTTSSPPASVQATPAPNGSSG